ncbi:hypothetical protein HZC09_04235 [Candidatus Micrarchaeota archaeon]|nr:hypothetical protein [Candidatus Micrarchaeota archaeon]
MWYYAALVFKILSYPASSNYFFSVIARCKKDKIMTKAEEVEARNVRKAMRAFKKSKRKASKRFSVFA